VPSAPVVPAASGSTSLDDHLAEIAASPRGARRLALFDFDGTLIHGYSAFTFLGDGVRRGRVSPGELAQVARLMALRELGRARFEDLLEVVTANLAGTPEAELVATGERLFTERLGGRIYEEAGRLLDAHRARGHTVVVCSAATRQQLAPVARALGVEHVLSTELEAVDGVFTGRVRASLWGDGKLAAAIAFARRRRAALTDAWFYSDGIEDLPLLERVGFPRPTNPDPELHRTAAERGWPVLRFTSRGGHTPADLVRTGLALSSLGPSTVAALAAVPTALVQRDRRSFLNLAMSTWGDYGTAVAGIHVRASGEEHLWSHRPAVFAFNHQSWIDVLVLLKLLRRDLTGVAKVELRQNPVVGPAFRLAGVAFVDRADRAQSVAALGDAVAKLRAGTSIVIAPEGTRSPTAALGPFKKGAFRLALAAQVPVVPVVIRNAGSVLPRGAYVIKPGTVEVAVLPPIPVTDWAGDDLDDGIAEVRQRFVDTLARWPDERDGRAGDGR
jgi:putative phosphoserine phosphatase/1-acylglycerol-3-phosphate O-acyltransferase